MSRTKLARVFVQAFSVVFCVAAATWSSDAEAGGRRRCCRTSCCTPVYYEPVCCPTWTPVTVRVCEPQCTTYYDSCGHRIGSDCGCAVVRYETISSAPACCGLATVESTTIVSSLAGDAAQPAPAVRQVAARAVERR